MADKIFCGTGKELFNGDMISVSFCLDDYPKEYMFKSDKSGKRYLKLNVCRKKDGADQYGKTHYVAVDTWKPDPNKAQQPQQNTQLQQNDTSFDNSDIPF